MSIAREQLLILLSTPLYIIVIGLEILLSHLRKQDTYSLKDTLQNLYLMALNSGIDLLFRTIYIGVILTFFYEHRLVEPIANPILYWVILLLFEDFMYYWLHRVDHYCRLFWATHFTHHSSSKFNLTVGFRSSVLEPLYRFIYFIPIAWLGFQPIDIVFIYSATQIWGILVHTEKINKMGVLEHILVTPPTTAYIMDPTRSIWIKTWGCFSSYGINCSVLFRKNCRQKSINRSNMALPNLWKRKTP